MELNALKKLTKDIADSSVTLTDKEARYLVDAFYIQQDNRIRSEGQVRSMAEEPHAVLAFFMDQNAALEGQVAKALDKYSAAHPVGQWARSQKGIGPIIAAGLLAHIDITKAPTAGHIWSFAGYDPNTKWLNDEGVKKVIDDVCGDEKKVSRDNLLKILKIMHRTTEFADNILGDGEAKEIYTKGEVSKFLKRRPFNAGLKTLCWKMSQSFVKVSGDENAFYGQIYKNRKLYEQDRNENGDYAEQAKKILETKNIGKDTDAYKAYIIGKLPPAHIQARACRYTSKYFLSHLHEVMYRNHYGVAPPKPFAIAVLGHAHQTNPPNFVINDIRD